VCARWFDQIIHIGPRLDEASQKIKTPLLMQLAEQDEIVDFQRAYEWFDACKTQDKKRIVYKGFYHEIYNEKDRQKPISDMIGWLVNL